MAERFVIVPAVPVESGTGSFDAAGRYRIKTLSAGFNIYDNHEKHRLEAFFPNRAMAQLECDGRNGQSFHVSREL